jgi:hypothetical protein
MRVMSVCPIQVHPAPRVVSHGSDESLQVYYRDRKKQAVEQKWQSLAGTRTTQLAPLPSIRNDPYGLARLRR